VSFIVGLLRLPRPLFAVYVAPVFGCCSRGTLSSLSAESRLIVLRPVIIRMLLNIRRNAAFLLQAPGWLSWFVAPLLRRRVRCGFSSAGSAGDLTTLAALVGAAGGLIYAAAVRQDSVYHESIQLGEEQGARSRFGCGWRAGRTLIPGRFRERNRVRWKATPASQGATEQTATEETPAARRKQVVPWIRGLFLPRNRRGNKTYASECSPCGRSVWSCRRNL